MLKHRGRRREPRHALRGTGGLLSAAILLIALAGTATSVTVTAENPYERGPDPTPQSIQASRGPFAVEEISVPASEVTGFGGGTIYAPTDTSQGTFGAISISPGFTAFQWEMAWYGPRLASNGFVVMTIDTLGLLDQPDARGAQLLASLDYLTNNSAVKGRIDPTRLGVMGHSMGGGGSLAAATTRPGLQAAIPLEPWHFDKDWSGIRVPTMIVGGENDTTASPAEHAIPFYKSIPQATHKAYLELKGADHRVPISPDPTIAKFSLSWLKRFIDNDTRYEQFLCPIPAPNDAISRYLGNCPYPP